MLYVVDDTFTYVYMYPAFMYPVIIVRSADIRIYEKKFSHIGFRYLEPIGPSAVERSKVETQDAKKILVKRID